MHQHAVDQDTALWEGNDIPAREDACAIYNTGLFSDIYHRNKKL